MYGCFEGGEQCSSIPKKKDVETNSFRVLFHNFFRSPIENFGDFVTAISLPTFRLSPPSIQNMMEGNDDEVAEWQATEVTLRDDRENEMIRQVMKQIAKQTKKSAKDESFTMVLELLHPDSTLPYRVYVHRGCKVVWAGHEEVLDNYSAASIPFMMQVKSERIEIADARDFEARRRWLIDTDEVDEDSMSAVDAVDRINDKIASMLQRK
jgi:hypothetical protein